MWIVDQVQTTWDCLVFPNHLSVQDSLIVLVYPFTFLAGLFVVGLTSWTRIKKCLNQTFQRGTRHVHFRVLFRTFVLHRGFSVVIIPIFLLASSIFVTLSGIIPPRTQVDEASIATGVPAAFAKIDQIVTLNLLFICALLMDLLGDLLPLPTSSRLVTWLTHAFVHFFYVFVYVFSYMYGRMAVRGIGITQAFLECAGNLLLPILFYGMVVVHVPLSAARWIDHWYNSSPWRRRVKNPLAAVLNFSIQLIITVLVMGWGEVLGDRMADTMAKNDGGSLAALFGHTPVLVCTSLGFLLGMLVLLGLLGVHIWDLMMNVNGVLPIFGKHLKFAGVAWGTPPHTTFKSPIKDLVSALVTALREAAQPPPVADDGQTEITFRDKVAHAATKFLPFLQVYNRTRRSDRERRRTCDALRPGRAVAVHEVQLKAGLALKANISSQLKQGFQHPPLEFTVCRVVPRRGCCRCMSAVLKVFARLFGCCVRRVRVGKLGVTGDGPGRCISIKPHQQAASTQRSSTDPNQPSLAPETSDVPAPIEVVKEDKKLFENFANLIDDLSKRLQHFQPENLGLVQKLPHVLKKLSKGDFSGLEDLLDQLDWRFLEIFLALHAISDTERALTKDNTIAKMFAMEILSRVTEGTLASAAGSYSSSVSAVIFLLLTCGVQGLMVSKSKSSLNLNQLVLEKHRVPIDFTLDFKLQSLPQVLDLVAQLAKESSKMVAEKIFGTWVEFSSSRKLEQLSKELTDIIAGYEWLEVTLESKVEKSLFFPWTRNVSIPFLTLRRGGSWETLFVAPSVQPMTVKKKRELQLSRFHKQQALHADNNARTVATLTKIRKHLPRYTNDLHNARVDQIMHKIQKKIQQLQGDTQVDPVLRRAAMRGPVHDPVPAATVDSGLSRILARNALWTRLEETGLESLLRFCDALVTVRVPLTKLLAEHENDNADNERVQQLLKEISAVQSLSESEGRTVNAILAKHFCFEDPNKEKVLQLQKRFRSMLGGGADCEKLCGLAEVFVSEGWTADVFDECEVENMRGLSRQDKDAVQSILDRHASTRAATSDDAGNASTSASTHASSAASDPVVQLKAHFRSQIRDPEDCETLCGLADVFVDNGWTADVIHECPVHKLAGLDRELKLKVISIFQKMIM